MHALLNTRMDSYAWFWFSNCFGKSCAGLRTSYNIKIFNPPLKQRTFFLSLTQLKMITNIIVQYLKNKNLPYLKNALFWNKYLLKVFDLFSTLLFRCLLLIPWTILSLISNVTINIKFLHKTKIIQTSGTWSCLQHFY